MTVLDPTRDAADLAGWFRSDVTSGGVMGEDVRG